jgi:hypothetical protein
MLTWLQDPDSGITVCNIKNRYAADSEVLDGCVCVCVLDGCVYLSLPPSLPPSLPLALACEPLLAPDRSLDRSFSVRVCGVVSEFDEHQPSCASSPHIPHIYMCACMLVCAVYTRMYIFMCIRACVSVCVCVCVCGARARARARACACA